MLSVGDRAILTHPGTIATTGPEVVDEDLLAGGAARPQRVVLPAAAPGPAPAAAVRAGPATAGATTSVDTNFDPAREWRGVAPLLGRTDVLMPNAAELLRADRREPTSTARRASSSTSAAGWR